MTVELWIPCSCLCCQERSWTVVFEQRWMNTAERMAHEVNCLLEAATK